MTRYTDIASALGRLMDQPFPAQAECDLPEVIRWIRVTTLLHPDRWSQLLSAAYQIQPTERQMPWLRPIFDVVLRPIRYAQIDDMDVVHIDERTPYSFMGLLWWQGFRRWAILTPYANSIPGMVHVLGMFFWSVIHNNAVPIYVAEVVHD